MDKFCEALGPHLALALTPPHKPILRSRTRGLLSADTVNKFNSSAWGKKIAVQAARKSLGDFDRFKLMVARVKKSAVVKRELAKLKKKA